jgi:hypothetical protein
LAEATPTAGDENKKLDPAESPIVVPEEELLLFTELPRREILGNSVAGNKAFSETQGGHVLEGLPGCRTAR